MSSLLSSRTALFIYCLELLDVHFVARLLLIMKQKVTHDFSDHIGTRSRFGALALLVATCVSRSWCGCGGWLVFGEVWASTSTLGRLLRSLSLEGFVMLLLAAGLCRLDRIILRFEALGLLLPSQNILDKGTLALLVGKTCREILRRALDDGTNLGEFWDLALFAVVFLIVSLWVQN